MIIFLPDWPETNLEIAAYATKKLFTLTEDAPRAALRISAGAYFDYLSELQEDMSLEFYISTTKRFIDTWEVEP